MVELDYKLIDIREEDILKREPRLLDLLLSDKTTGCNILWATSNYAKLGEDYFAEKEIKPVLITDSNTMLIQPRNCRCQEEQTARTKGKAEVFTPSWVCNKQNNLIDKAWFGRSHIFNVVKGNTWETTKKVIKFPKKLNKSWEDYVKIPRLEVSCGEAPYLVSRYDTVNGKWIDIEQRIGLLDRKLRVIYENTKEFEEWFYWVKEAYKSIYAFEYQGDNLLLARENLLLTFWDWLLYKWDKDWKKDDDAIEKSLELADIIAWNVWQMDGIKMVIPNSCHEEKIVTRDLFSEVISFKSCPGCQAGGWQNHNGIYPVIKDWSENKNVLFINFIKTGY